MVKNTMPACLPACLLPCPLTNKKNPIGRKNAPKRHTMLFCVLRWILKTTISELIKKGRRKP